MYAKIKKMMDQCRLDPYIGVMHVDAYNKPAFIFDFMEGQRILCEEIAYQACQQEARWIREPQKQEKGV